VPGADPLAASAATVTGQADTAPLTTPDIAPPNSEPATKATSRESAVPRQIVLIEAAVPDANDLIQDLWAGAQAVLLNPDHDGAQQFAAHLTSHSITALAGINLPAHGADADVSLGTATFNAATLGDYQAQLTTIGAAVAAGGAIQIRDCDPGQDAAGVATLDQLSQVTDRGVRPRWAIFGRGADRANHRTGNQSQ
jgi:hypothetical protein